MKFILSALIKDYRAAIELRARLAVGGFGGEEEFQIVSICRDCHSLGGFKPSPLGDGVSTRAAD